MTFTPQRFPLSLNFTTSKHTMSESNEPESNTLAPPQSEGTSHKGDESKSNAAVHYFFSFLAFIGIGLLGRAFGSAFGGAGFLGLTAYGSFYWAYLGFKGRFPFAPGVMLAGVAGMVAGTIFLCIGGFLVYFLFVTMSR